MISRSGMQRVRLRCVAVAPLLTVLLTLWCTQARADSLMDSVSQYAGDIRDQSLRMMSLVALAGILAIVVAVPAGIYLSRPSQRHGAAIVMQALNIGQAVPKIAVLALAMSAFGIGAAPAVLALWIATILPIAMNTYQGLLAVPRPLIEAATGIGMTPFQILMRVELPNALYVIFAGIRTAFAISVGTAPLAFLIGAGGLGELIFTGISLNDFGMLLAGAVPTALLAIFTDLLISQLQRRLVSPGVNPQSLKPRARAAPK
jgi:osmoprotectant transport system permease protein